MSHDTPQAVEILARHFFSLLKSSAGLAEFEGRVMDDVMAVASAAMGRALEELDDWLLGNYRVPGLEIRDRRGRTLLAECGQAGFSRRVFRTREGMRFCLLDITPGAFGMVARDALCDAYARAATPAPPSPARA